MTAMNAFTRSDSLQGDEVDHLLCGSRCVTNPVITTTWPCIVPMACYPLS